MSLEGKPRSRGMTGGLRLTQSRPAMGTELSRAGDGVLTLRAEHLRSLVGALHQLIYAPSRFLSWDSRNWMMMGLSTVTRSAPMKRWPMEGTPTAAPTVGPAWSPP